MATVSVVRHFKAKIATQDDSPIKFGKKRLSKYHRTKCGILPACSVILSTQSQYEYRIENPGFRFRAGKAVPDDDANLVFWAAQVEEFLVGEQDGSF